MWCRPGGTPDIVAIDELIVGAWAFPRSRRISTAIPFWRIYSGAGVGRGDVAAQRAM